MARCILALLSAKSTLPNSGIFFFDRNVLDSELEPSFFRTVDSNRWPDFARDALVVASETGCLGRELLSGGDFCSGSALIKAFRVGPGGTCRAANGSYLRVARVGRLDEADLGGPFSFSRTLPFFGDAGPAGKWFLDAPLDTGKRVFVGDVVSLLLGRRPLLTGMREGRSGELCIGDESWLALGGEEKPLV